MVDIVAFVTYFITTFMGLRYLAARAYDRCDRRAYDRCGRRLLSRELLCRRQHRHRRVGPTQEESGLRSGVAGRPSSVLYTPTHTVCRYRNSRNPHRRE